MQRQVETGSGSLKFALNLIFKRGERRELNRSFEVGIAEGESLCHKIRLSKMFVENGICMDSPKVCPWRLGCLRVAYF